MRLRVDHDTASFRDDRGRRITLRGINMGGRSKRPPFMPFEYIRDKEVTHHANTMLDRAWRWGLDVIRLPFSWEALEPEPGQWDTSHLDRMAHMLDAAHARDIGVVLDFHQDIYATPLCGDGFPTWTLPPSCSSRIMSSDRSWYMRYVADPHVIECFDRLWANEEGILDAMVEMWRRVLTRFADHPALIGVELLNEPGWGSRAVDDFLLTSLRPFYERCIDDFRRTHPDLIFFYGVPGIDFMDPARGAPLPRREQIVFAPHYYDPGLLVLPHAGPLLDTSKQLADLGGLSLQEGVPVFVGEFGITHGASGGLAWLEQVFAGFDKHQLHGTLWECSESAWRWNGEDLNVLGPQLEERPILDTIARPWLRALGGDDADCVYDARKRRLEARWFSSGETTQFVIPARYAPDGPTRVELWADDAEHHFDRANAVYEVDAPEGEYIEAHFQF